MRRVPGPGEMVLSPALEKLLGSDEGKLLRERFPFRPVGTIGDSGLVGPDELFYYAGSDRIAVGSGAVRIDHYAADEVSDPRSPAVMVLITMVCVVLLLPVAVFIATAVRFGGERRDRRLAALRLVGADARTVRRIAAGEALCGSLLGLVVGVVILLFARRFAPYVTIQETNVFPADLTPGPGLAALVAVAVPASAVVVTLFALRGVVIEPLGIVRDTVARRRHLWWRLLIPALGALLLVPLLGRASLYSYGTGLHTVQVAAGAVLLLIGVTALLPWLVEACVARLRGGPPPWQLAVRRLQVNSGPAARAVSGITVAVAGAIAVQMLFQGMQSDYTDPPWSKDAPSQLQADHRAVPSPEAHGYVDRFRATKGVTAATGFVDRYAQKEGDSQGVTSVMVGDCATLSEIADIGSCRDGDVFISQEPGGPVDTARRFAPGTRLVMEEYAPPGHGSPRTYRWTVPASARVVPTVPDPHGEHQHGVLVTPSAIDLSAIPNARTRLLIRVRPGDPDAIEAVRNTAAAIDPGVRVWRMGGVVKDSHYAAVERGLLIGATLTLALIGASMLVSMLEQLRERRQQLSVLVAFGTRRSTIGWSVLWQTAIPVALGLALAVAGGLGLGWLALRLVDRTVKDWLSFLPLVGGGAAVMILVTLVGLPPLWRMMRPDGLRTE
ncbi:FtsX-like permease family protein [Streptomyces sp. ISL-11]|uniref:FtsX-like permease family protein n=1 Tax=Streptomyces sp. ISL-11 TaxID=2819174 RepID=UPI0027E4EF2E|nr:FtsX-like permease family protein [Streptomyces sp. ISL-11]